MASTTLISNHVTNANRSSSSSSSSKRKKKRLLQRDELVAATQNHNPPNGSTQWKSEKQQQIYSSKLLQALRHVRQSSAQPRRGRAVREAADRVLAATAKGRSRWSRAILTSRLKLKFMKNKRQRVLGVGVGGGNTTKKKPRLSILRLKAKNLPAVQRKVRVLGRLVPGCRKEPLPVILEEATDYIAALEMQVRAMSALAELLSVSGAAGSSRPPPPPPPTT